MIKKNILSCFAAFGVLAVVSQPQRAPLDMLTSFHPKRTEDTSFHFRVLVTDYVTVPDKKMHDQERKHETSIPIHERGVSEAARTLTWSQLSVSALEKDSSLRPRQSINQAFAAACEQLKQDHLVYTGATCQCVEDSLAVACVLPPSSSTEDFPYRYVIHECDASGICDSAQDCYCTSETCGTGGDFCLVLNKNDQSCGIIFGTSDVLNANCCTQCDPGELFEGVVMDSCPTTEESMGCLGTSIPKTNQSVTPALTLPVNTIAPTTDSTLEPSDNDTLETNPIFDGVLVTGTIAEGVTLGYFMLGIQAQDKISCFTSSDTPNGDLDLFMVFAYTMEEEGTDYDCQSISDTSDEICEDIVATSATTLYVIIDAWIGPLDYTLQCDVTAASVEAPAPDPTENPSGNPTDHPTGQPTSLASDDPDSTLEPSDNDTLETNPIFDGVLVTGTIAEGVTLGYFMLGIQAQDKISCFTSSDTPNGDLDLFMVFAYTMEEEGTDYDCQSISDTSDEICEDIVATSATTLYVIIDAWIGPLDYTLQCDVTAASVEAPAPDPTENPSGNPTDHPTDQLMSPASDDPSAEPSSGPTEVSALTPTNAPTVAPTTTDQPMPNMTEDSTSSFPLVCEQVTGLYQESAACECDEEDPQRKVIICVFPDPPGYSDHAVLFYFSNEEDSLTRASECYCPDSVDGCEAQGSYCLSVALLESSECSMSTVNGDDKCSSGCSLCNSEEFYGVDIGGGCTIEGPSEEGCIITNIYGEIGENFVPASPTTSPAVPTLAPITATLPSQATVPPTQLPTVPQVEVAAFDSIGDTYIYKNGFVPPGTTPGQEDTMLVQNGPGDDEDAYSLVLFSLSSKDILTATTRSGASQQNGDFTAQLCLEHERNPSAADPRTTIYSICRIDLGGAAVSESSLDVDGMSAAIVVFSMPASCMGQKIISFPVNSLDEKICIDVSSVAFLPVEQSVRKRHLSPADNDEEPVLFMIDNLSDEEQVVGDRFYTGDSSGNSPEIIVSLPMVPKQAPTPAPISIPTLPAPSDTDNPNKGLYGLLVLLLLIPLVGVLVFMECRRHKKRAEENLRDHEWHMAANKNFTERTSDPTTRADDEELGCVEETSHMRDISSSSEDSSEDGSADHEDHGEDNSSEEWSNEHDDDEEEDESGDDSDDDSSSDGDEDGTDDSWDDETIEGRQDSSSAQEHAG